MNTYRVTMDLDKHELIEFLDAGGSFAPKASIKSIVEEVDVIAPKSAAPRAKRGSKVNGTILDALGDGPRTIKQLKESLENAGLSPGSLSTGLAILQKAREVQRVEDGVYALTKQAAE